MDPSAPRDPNAPSQMPEGEARPPAPPPPAAPPSQGWQTQTTPPPPQGNWQGQGTPPPPGQSWQTQPGGPGTQPGQPPWMANLTSREAVPAPAGFVYADVPNRIIAMIIDLIVMFLVFFVIGAITLAIFGVNAGFFQIPTTTSLLAQQVISALLWAAYFIYTWVNMRGTPGMKALSLQIGHETDGRNLTYEQAAWRFGVMFGPQIVVGLLAALVPALGLLGLLSFVWLIYVLYTIGQSPTKQGIHDRYAHSMVVKAR